VAVSDPLAGLSREKFYVPGSLLRAAVDSSNPLAFGMGPEALMFFDNSPAFQISGQCARSRGSHPEIHLLVDGPGDRSIWREPLPWPKLQWVRGSSAVGSRGRVRGQSHGTFKLLFNALYWVGHADPYTAVEGEHASPDIISSAS
jgi:hypothetical protein